MKTVKSFFALASLTLLQTLLVANATAATVTETDHVYANIAKDSDSGVGLLNKLDKNDLCNDGAPRYVYTKKYGYVDMKHFAAAAKLTRWVGKRDARFLGVVNEVVQGVMRPSSSFSYEDLSSNNAGIEFGASLPSDFTSSEFLQRLTSFFTNIGALDTDHPDNPKDTLPEEESSNPERSFKWW